MRTHRFLLMLALMLAVPAAVWADAVYADDAEDAAQDTAKDAGKRFFALYDADEDGRLSREEFPAWLQSFFATIDANGDGFVDRREDARYRKAAARPPRRTRAPLPAPKHADVRYGPHARNVYDLWLADAEGATPLVVYFHGGGFGGGDKRSLDPAILRGLLARGISVAAANYRLTKTAPFPAQMHDAARAVQHLRHHAHAYGLDGTRIGATGGSAGAGISLWLAFHDDLADPAAADPVARQSTRLSVALVYGGQSTYDPRTIQKLFDTRDVHGALIAFFGMSGPEDLDDERFHPLFEEASPITHATADDPPVYLYYGQANAPLPPNSQGGQHIHHPRFGFFLKEKLDPLGVECVVRLRDEAGAPEPIEEYVLFFVEKLAAPRAPSHR